MHDDDDDIELRADAARRIGRGSLLYQSEGDPALGDGMGENDGTWMMDQICRLGILVPIAPLAFDTHRRDRKHRDDDDAYHHRHHCHILLVHSVIVDTDR